MNKSAIITKENWKTLEKKTRQEIPDSCLFLDLRSEAEYALGHISNAYSLPLLSNQERHEVGYTYKSQGKQEAIELGLEIFAKKSHAFVKDFEKILAKQKNKSPDIIVYCWRGGMRSHSVALFLSSMGYKITLLEGGYKNYRKSILTEIKEKVSKHTFLVLHGLTGAGKTELIKEVLTKNIIGCLDLEGLAKHRGSTFGDFNQTEEPATQQQFENDLYCAYQTQKHHKVILVEIEGRLGHANVHPDLRKKIINSPMLLITRDYDERIKALVKEYTSKWSEKTNDLFLKRFSRIQEKISKEDFEKIKRLAQEKNFTSLIDSLLKNHYDKIYNKSIKRHNRLIIKEFNISSQKQEAFHYIKDYVSLKKYDKAD